MGFTVQTLQRCSLNLNQQKTRNISTVHFMTTIDDRLTIDLWLSLWIVVKNNGSKSRLGDETLWKKGEPWDLAKNWISLQPINIFPGERKILGAKIPLWLPKYCIFQAKQPQILSHHKTNRNNSTTATMTTIPTITNCRQTTIMTSTSTCPVCSSSPASAEGSGEAAAAAEELEPAVCTIVLS